MLDRRIDSRLPFGGVNGRGDLSEAGTWEIVSVTLAKMMAAIGHYSIDSTTIRAHVSAAGVIGSGGKRRAPDESQDPE